MLVNKFTVILIKLNVIMFISVNAADNKMRDPGMNCIKIDIEP